MYSANNGYCLGPGNLGLTLGFFLFHDRICWNTDNNRNVMATYNGANVSVSIFSYSFRDRTLTAQDKTDPKSGERISRYGWGRLIAGVGGNLARILFDPVMMGFLHDSSRTCQFHTLRSK